ncbi:putative polysaccharide biosynthesis protein [Paenibacillus sp. IHBB 10380]|uniref:putative polysaccharide biosynthesis protein n=1 Tax=Paenibacillus sp. IHBB 10380 TaxID=1566358 RepID=UPI0005CFAF0B|nr:oligosaccharide flippase family protein [Paenibacillus sp. IHBB 10380]AJS60739.1 membrane protein [Paenibacillus sp. IHBB 10380]
MKETNAATRILHGAFILSTAAILSKLIGTLQKIPLQNMGGDEVFGIYNTVYPFYSLIITLAIAGFPVAISKFVAEDMANGNESGGRRIISLSSFVLSILGIILGVSTYVGAPLIGLWIDNSQVVPAIRYVSWALLFVPIMSALRGYFQGLQNMIPTAVSQIVEQSVRVAVMILFLLYLTSRQASSEQIAAGALFGSVAGGAAGLLVMLLYWRNHRRDKIVEGISGKGASSASLESTWSLLKRLLVYAIPVCLGSLAVPLISLVDTFTVPRLLKASGVGEAGAMIQFGIYNRGIPLVQLASMMATSLAVLFIPALAEARIRGDQRLVQSQCRLSLRWFWMLGLAASVGLAVLAEPINVMLYQDAAGTDTMRWIAFTAAGSTVSLISAALLQGIGSVKEPAVHLLAAAVAKMLLNLLLVPHFGITGAAMAGVAAHFLAAALNVALLAHRTGLRPSAGTTVFKPVVIIAGLALAAGSAQWATGAALLTLGLQGARMVATVGSFTGVVAGATAFLILAVLTKLLSEEELRMLPKIGNALALLLKKLRVLQ